jgi:ERG8-type phosphomevalonate kinase
MNAVNVPGKILFYGGFSVLEKGNIALSIAVCGEDGRGVVAEAEAGARQIVSPQFNLDIAPALGDGQIVSFAYVFAEQYLKSCNKWKGDVKLKLENSPIFGQKDQKTGLGSSAAATVAVVKALFEANGVDPNAHVETLHKISQLAYAAYSKKVGSGFDIATSSFGKSIIYNRYDPSELALPASQDSSEVAKSISSSVNKPWGWVKAIPIEFPRQYRMLFFNIKRGKTDTISSVKAAMEWKKSNADEYKRIISAQKKAEEKAVDALLGHRSASVRKWTHRARDAHRELQNKVKGTVSNFDPIEPEQLTAIIEGAEAMDGVVAGRCPGAGGYDGVAFIAKRKFKDIEKIVSLGDKNSLKLEYIPLRVL